MRLVCKRMKASNSCLLSPFHIPSFVHVSSPPSPSSETLICRKRIFRVIWKAAFSGWGGDPNELQLLSQKNRSGKKSRGSVWAVPGRYIRPPPAKSNLHPFLNPPLPFSAGTFQCVSVLLCSNTAIIGFLFRATTNCFSHLEWEIRCMSPENGAFSEQERGKREWKRGLRQVRK